MTPPPKRVREPTGTAVTNYDEELAKYAAQAAEQEASSAGGEFFSTKGGILKFAGNALPHNQVPAIIVDHVFENVYYAGKFDADSPSAPMCYAFGSNDKELEPHENVLEQGTNQHDTCKGCPMNEWGSADTGRGKACRNTRRLALIPAGGFDASGTVFEAPNSVSEIEEASIAFLKLPVTSVKGFAGWVQQTASVMKRPPFAVFARIKVVPDAGTQFRVEFTALGPVPTEYIKAVMAKREEAQAALYAPYPAYEEPAAPPPRKPAPAPVRRSRDEQPPAPAGAPAPRQRRF